MVNIALRSEKIEESIRSWTPHGGRYGNSSGTPIIRERSNREKRWSVESTTSLTSTHDYTQNKPFVWQMPFTVKCIGTFKLVYVIPYLEQRIQIHTHTHTHLHFRGHKGTIWSLLTYGNWLFSSSSDGTIKAWDIADLRKGCVKTVSAHKDCVSMCVASGNLDSLPPPLPTHT